MIAKMLESLCGLLNKGVRWSLGGVSLVATRTRLIEASFGAGPSDTGPQTLRGLSKELLWGFDHSENLGFYPPHRLPCLLANVLLPSGKMAVRGFL